MAKSPRKAAKPTRPFPVSGYGNDESHTSSAYTNEEELDGNGLQRTPHDNGQMEIDGQLNEEQQNEDSNPGDGPGDDTDSNSDGGQPPPRNKVGAVPSAARKNPPNYVPPTRFAGSYRSRLTDLSRPIAPELLPKLTHVNCSYLSSRGVVPTLEELKQHAQALTILISHLSVSTRGGYIDNANITIDDGNGNRMPIPAFEKGETYDWLNDLENRYENHEEHHGLPLTSIVNMMEPTPQGRGSIDVCPLHRASPTEPNTPSLPYATHQSLIAHANEVLELLDHEYSAKGGLLAILPLAEEKEERALAETTLLGQLILWTQRLVQRVHELERLYANAMDVLAGEAAVPSQTLNKLGVDGRQGRAIVFPQDRFVLVNAGEDVWQFLSRELDKRDRIAEELRQNAVRNHVVGGDKWLLNGGKEYNAGVSAVDITTRYFRIRNSQKNLKTIFMVPAWQEHPGTKITRDMENKPTVVTVVRPVWPERASVWEMKNRDELDYAKKHKRDSDDYKKDRDNFNDARVVLETQLDLAKSRARKAEEKLQNIATRDELAFKKRLDEVDEEKERIEKQKQETEKMQKQAQKTLEDAQKQARNDEAQRSQFMKQLTDDRKKEKQAQDKIMQELQERYKTLDEEFRGKTEQMQIIWAQAIDKTNDLSAEVMAKHQDLTNEEVILRQRIAKVEAAEARIANSNWGSSGGRKTVSWEDQLPGGRWESSSLGG